jgi:hypothetical protein
MLGILSDLLLIPAGYWYAKNRHNAIACKFVNNALIRLDDLGDFL